MIKVDMSDLKMPLAVGMDRALVVWLVLILRRILIHMCWSLLNADTNSSNTLAVFALVDVFFVGSCCLVIVLVSYVRLGISHAWHFQ